ncbi:MAG: transcriptional regulator NrdR [Spirochaetia bacterium]|nr:transcriptional regulator NrdR [Spirochaetia bacterium]
MRCPNCGYPHDKVLESRLNSTGSTTRRRRECLRCGYRFTSYERIEEKPITVIKKDGRLERFDIKKVERGIRTCTDKLKISEDVLEKLLQDIEDNVDKQAGSKREIASSAIGEEALRQLSRISTVAYVRFASVYRAFDTLDQFIQEIERLDAAGKENRKQEEKD